MKRVLVILGGVVLGLGAALGAVYGLRSAEAPGPRAAHVLTEFERICMGFQRGDAPVPAGYDRVTLTPEDIQWVDREAQMILTFSDVSCSFSDALFPLSRREIGDIQRGLPDLIARYRPELADRLRETERGHLWQVGPTGSPEAWGVGLASHVLSDSVTMTVLDYSPPPSAAPAARP